MSEINYPNRTSLPLQLDTSFNNFTHITTYIDTYFDLPAYSYGQPYFIYIDALTLNVYVLPIDDYNETDPYTGILNHPHKITRSKVETLITDEVINVNSIIKGYVFLFDNTDLQSEVFNNNTVVDGGLLQTHLQLLDRKIDNNIIILLQTIKNLQDNPISLSSSQIDTIVDAVSNNLNIDISDWATLNNTDLIPLTKLPTSFISNNVNTWAIINNTNTVPTDKLPIIPEGNIPNLPASKITSGNIADNIIPTSIARDTEVNASILANSTKINFVSNLPTTINATTNTLYIFTEDKYTLVLKDTDGTTDITEVSKGDIVAYDGTNFIKQLISIGQGTSIGEVVGKPTISGTTNVDSLLTVNTGTIWDIYGLGSFSYQWIRGTTDIPGATSTTYTLVSADVTTQISVKVSWTSIGNNYIRTLTSEPTVNISYNEVNLFGSFTSNSKTIEGIGSVQLTSNSVYTDSGDLTSEGYAPYRAMDGTDTLYATDDTSVAPHFRNNTIYPTITALGSANGLGGALGDYYLQLALPSGVTRTLTYFKFRSYTETHYQEGVELLYSLDGSTWNTAYNKVITSVSDDVTDKVLDSPVVFRFLRITNKYSRYDISKDKVYVLVNFEPYGY